MMKGEMDSVALELLEELRMIPIDPNEKNIAALHGVISSLIGIVRGLEMQIEWLKGRRS